MSVRGDTGKWIPGEWEARDDVKEREGGGDAVKLPGNFGKTEKLISSC